MTNITHILAAHGAGDDSPSNRYIRQLAETLNRMGEFAEVICAFRKGTPTFSDVLERVRTRQVIVLPIMTSEGYFSRKVLPRSLAESPGSGDLNVTIMAPLGTNPAIIEITEEIIVDAATAMRFSPDDAEIILAGHGTRQFAGSCSRTVEVAEALGKRHADWSIRTAFLDETPYLADVDLAAMNRPVIAVPFLIGGGQHVSIDIPRLLGISESGSESTPPLFGRIGNRVRVCTTAVGMHRRIPGLVRNLFRAASPKTQAGAA